MAHLVLRTAQIRSVFAKGAGQVFDGIIAAIGTRKGARAHYGIDDAIPGRLISPLVAATTKSLTDAGVAIPSRLAERIVAMLVRERFDDFFNEYESVVQGLYEDFTRRMPRLISDAHNKALAKIDQAKWETALATLTWRTVEVEGAILPDCIAIAKTATG